MSTNQAKAFLSRFIASLPGRWFWLLVGLGSLAWGQYLMNQPATAGKANPSADFWNAVYRLEVPNLGEAMLAVPFLISGALLWGLFGSRQTQEDEPVSSWQGGGQISRTYIIPRLPLIALGTFYLLLQLARHQYHPLLFWLWLGLLIWISRVFWKWDLQKEIDLSPGLERSDLAWIAGLFALTLFVGVFALKDIPNAIISDEGSFWEAARSIAAGEYHPAFFDFGVYTFPIASSIYQSWVMRIAGVSLWGWRFTSVLAGAAATLPLYSLGRAWFGRSVAVSAVLAMLANPYFLVYTRLGYNNIQALFPLTLSLYLWLKATQKSSFFYLWLAGVAAGLGFYTYPAALLAFPVIGISALILWLRRGISFRRLLILGGILILALAMLFGPRLAYGASGERGSSFVFKLLETTFTNSFYAKAYYGEADLYHILPPIRMAGIELYYEPTVYYEMLVRGLVRTTLVLFDPFIHRERFMVAPFPGVLTPLFFLIGFVIALRNWKQRRFQLLLIWAISGLFLFSVLSAFPPSSTHTVAVIPAFALLSGVGIVAGIEQITVRLRDAIRQWLRSILLGILLILVTSLGWYTYFVEMPRLYPPTFEDIVSWIAWRTKAPLTLIYVGPNVTTQHQVGYLVDTHMVADRLVSTTSQDFDWGSVPARSVVFYEAQPRGIPLPPPRFKNFVTYTDPDRELLGYAWSNTEVDLQPWPLFPGTYGKFPVTIIPIFSALAIIVLLLLTVKIHVRIEKPGLRVRAKVTVRKTRKKEADEGS
jgi:4-amino-4-deoxy-L-arabinose transferase-like glycosyltransferase